MINATSQYMVKLSGSLSSDPTSRKFDLNLTTNGGNVTFFNMYYLLVHTNNSLTEYIFFIDTGSISGALGIQAGTPSFVSRNPLNSIFGLTSFKAKSASNFDF